MKESEVDYEFQKGVKLLSVESVAFRGLVCDVENGIQ